MLDAAEAYLAQGGRFVYLGGNGFYWVTSFDPERPHVIEVRRTNGTRAWSARPGEYRHSTTGEIGGLWRERGRAPQRLAGVGFAGQGAGRGQPYRRTAAAADPRAAWIFAGVTDEVFGDEGLVVDGAAGFEIDRADVALGTPPHALVVATAIGFSDRYQHAIEEVAMSNSRQGGTIEPRVRADLTFFETPERGRGLLGGLDRLRGRPVRHSPGRVGGADLADHPQRPDPIPGRAALPRVALLLGPVRRVTSG